LILTNPEGVEFTYALRFQFVASCGPDDRVGNDPEANLLYKPCITEPKTKLLANRETGFVTGLRSKKTPKDDCKSEALCLESIILHTDRGHRSKDKS
nr:hypothetical protein [Tanacetum cinerariifolium]